MKDSKLGVEIARNYQTIKKLLKDGVKLKEVYAIVNLGIGEVSFVQKAPPILDAIDYITNNMANELLTAREEITKLTIANELLTQEEMARLTIANELLTQEEMARLNIANELLTSEVVECENSSHLRNEVPKKLNGWNVRKDAHGHYRMYKRLNGRLIGKYVGRVWDNVKALQVAGGV